jgi:hypothetical protein
MAMTLPQKKAPADAMPPLPSFLEIENGGDGDRGPANAIIARLAQAIAEQNVSNQTDPAAQQKGHRFKMRSLLALALGSATLWGVIILTIWTLL